MAGQRRGASRTITLPVNDDRARRPENDVVNVPVDGHERLGEAVPGRSGLQGGDRGEGLRAVANSARTRPKRHRLARTGAARYPPAMPHAHLDASILIDASAQRVFDRMNDLSRFNDWNPFPTMDATTVSRHEGPASGPGAVFEYEGKRLGKGRMEIASIEPPARIDIAMTFWRNGVATNSSSAFVITDLGAQSEVHWTFDEDRGWGMYLLGKVLFDGMMTKTFGTGLQTLKTLVEAEASS